MLVTPDLLVKLLLSKDLAILDIMYGNRHLAHVGHAARVGYAAPVGHPASVGHPESVEHPTSV